MREARVKRKTEETEVEVRIGLDGKGRSEISTGIPFFDHMLELFAMHGLFDLELKAKGDLEVDFHHTVEDVGICLGEAVRKAIGEARGIRRFGNALVPMDEALAQVALDISGRPFLSYRVKAKGKIREFDLEVVEGFFKALCDHAGLTLHISLLQGRNLHHICEAIFKAVARALDEATQRDPRRDITPSTKGVI